jgi:DNA primase
MKFPDSFLDEIRARLPVSQVVSRHVSLKRRGREFVGLSPFNREKTPSFTVNDQKGFYHCFSSGKHGDQFAFVMETEGLSFPEAVEKLAGEAGLPMPKPDPQFERVEKERLGLFDALEAAASFFERALHERDGRDALAYAGRRGLKPDTLKLFRIGYAPGTKDALKGALLKRGFTESQLLEAGLLVKPDDGRSPFDRFRHRLVIPILDPRGRVIAFGARALDDAAQPKYLNSPETKLFDKGATLFNFAQARKAAFASGELIVVEGYMDVIALHQAGFENVVATLGTAFTERQMERLWLLALEPVICFDGDRAGEAAAARAIDRMLPQLREGHSFRFAFLPEGTDPDDLVRAQGPSALAQCLAAASPLIDVVWLRELKAGNIDTPERRAAFEARLEGLLTQITNARVRDHYRREVKDRLFVLWREKGRRGAPGQQAAPRAAVAMGTSPPPSAQGFAITVILALANHPWLLDRFAEEVATLELKPKPLAELLAFLTRTIFDQPGIGRERVAEIIAGSRHGELLDRLAHSSAFKRLAFLQPETPQEEVEDPFADLLYRWRALPALEREVWDAAPELAELSEAEFEHFAELQQQVANAGSRHAADDAGDREAEERFKAKIAEVLREKGAWQKGRRPDHRGERS